MSELLRRYEDMSPDGQLQILIQSDGDAVISIFAKDSGGEFRWIDVEFCTYNGGGKSPNTLRALIALHAAVKLDNEQEPSRNPDAEPPKETLELQEGRE